MTGERRLDDTALAGVPLALAHGAEIGAALSALAARQGERALSDPVFSNLYLFRRAHDYRYLPGPFACIAGRTYDGASHLVPLFELQLAPVDALRDLLRDRSCFYPLPAAGVEALDPDVFEWSSSRDDSDYLYPAAQFVHYRGKALSKKHNLARQLRAAHVVTAEPCTPALVDVALAVLAGWMQAKGKAEGEADELACTEALRLSQRLGLQGYVYRADAEPAGFLLAQCIQPGVWVMRFAKGLDRFKGVYQHMFQHFCSSVPGVQWVNFEQDMGLASFRRTKLSYRPSDLIPKYRVRLR